MKLTKSQLKQIIKEEYEAVLEEEELEEGSGKKRKFLANPKANEKAEEIYKACIRSTKSAGGASKNEKEICARTAKRQGPPGAQKQGPPYEDPLARPLK